MSKGCIVLFQTSLYFLIQSSKRGIYTYGVKKWHRVKKKHPAIFRIVHSADDICDYMETKTTIVNNNISELNFEHNILPIIFHILTQNAQMR